jgi:hypothetical protein
MESVEYKGIWWKPEHTENKYNGKFYFNTDEGGILELDGVFDGESHPIIHGITNTGKEITLQHAFNTKWSMPYAGRQGESKIYVNTTFIGNITPQFRCRLCTFDT